MADDKEQHSPTYLDGTPVPTEEVEDVAGRIQRGEMKIEFAPEALQDLKDMGMSVEEMEAIFRKSIGIKPQ
jgi:hypothetical protein